MSPFLFFSFPFSFPDVPFSFPFSPFSFPRCPLFFSSFLFPFLFLFSFPLLRDGTTYAELGADYFDRLDTDRLTRTLVRRLERLGHEVVLKPKEPAA
jgi:hypothetical protein